jgi:SAM-dependent methyltransferase
MTGSLRRRYPTDPEQIRSSKLGQAQWYYSIELAPGFVTEGQYAPELPMLPRLMLRRCDVTGMSCLDVGTMEGLVPTLLRKRGASDVLAVDFSNHCLGKLAAVQHYHGVDFEYRSVGLMYGLSERIGPRSFDLVNLSGIMYHVCSPLHLLAAVRPLVKRGGLMVVSSPVTLDPGYVMDFNAGGRFQPEGNTFWYPSARLFDYLLRYMRLEPIDCAFLRHADDPAHGTRDKPSGYACVVCRAVDTAGHDAWMQESARTSWEYQGLSDWALAASQPVSTIGYRSPNGAGTIDLPTAIEVLQPVPVPAAEDDSHTLRLTATS